MKNYILDFRPLTSFRARLYGSLKEIVQCSQACDPTAALLYSEHIQQSSVDTLFLHDHSATCSAQQWLPSIRGRQVSWYLAWLLSVWVSKLLVSTLNRGCSRMMSAKNEGVQTRAPQNDFLESQYCWYLLQISREVIHSRNHNDDKPGVVILNLEQFKPVYQARESSLVKHLKEACLGSRYSLTKICLFVITWMTRSVEAV